MNPFIMRGMDIKGGINIHSIYVSTTKMFEHSTATFTL